MNEAVINELVNFFKLKTSLDLFYRVGIGAIENQQLKDYAAQKSNTFINFFKNKIKRSASTTADDDIHKQIISSNYANYLFENLELHERSSIEMGFQMEKQSQEKNVDL